MESLPISLPAAPAPTRRPSLPIMAAIVPIAAGVVLWLVSGSLFALCFAALGPLMIVASLIDAARIRRREKRRSDAEAEEGWASAERELARRQQDERARRRLREPDAASCLAHPPLRGTNPLDATTTLVVGSGVVPSGIRCSGGDDPRTRDFRERCATLLHAPIALPLARGVCLRGARPLVAAVARALVLQLCLRYSVAQLSLVGEDLAGHGLDDLPHAAHVRRNGFRMGLTSAGGRVDADAVVWMMPSGSEVPDGITTVIDVVEPGRATLRTAQGISEIAVECLSSDQAETIARECLQQTEDVAVLPAVVALDELEQTSGARGLPAVIGRSEHEAIIVDIVEHGPHAIVTGTTGTGKSELLVTWVTAIASAHGPDRVSFVLADFKGGTAFEPLRGLRQVAAVITDLDEEGARRGVSSLTAELRRRESVLAAAGARDVCDTTMPRLVIVVDEFAALLQDHSELGAVFTDVAARGRALGMHLILGTQRATGVVRDALAANCPLRISLRVSDAADSRIVLGTEAASELPGGPESRGLALVRRPEDRDPVALRIALTSASDLRRTGLRWVESEQSRSPWLPALASSIPLAEVAVAAGNSSAVEGPVVLGRADDPEHQSQPLVTLDCGVERGLAIIGAAGSGRSTALRAIAVQHPGARWVSRDLEHAWDTISAWATRAEILPPVVLCDDIDALLAGLPPEHAQHFVQRWERVLREGTETTFVLTAARSAGPLARLVDSMPRRALLRTPSRMEHIAAGGESTGFLRDRRPGRARMGEREVQFVWTDHEAPRVEVKPPSAAWRPDATITAIVSSAANSDLARLRDAYPGSEVIVAGTDPLRRAGPRIVVADAESWQRNWSLWQRIRGEGEVLVRVEQPSDLRQLAGVRELPPFARPHAGRAWSLRAAGSPRRVIVPALAPR